MDRLQAMQVFAKVVEVGSFTAAADHLDLPRPTATTLVQGLETHLGVRLLHRTTRRVSLTEDGARYYEHCRNLLAALEEAEALFHEAGIQPKGQLRVDLPQEMARRIVIPALPDFFARYPDIELKFGVTDRLVDLVGESIDCVVRVGHLADSSLVGRRVGELEQINVASRAYLQRHGRPQTLEDLAQHTVIRFFSAQTGRVFDWEYHENGRDYTVPMHSHISVNNAAAYHACCIAGLGIMQAPRSGLKEWLASGELEEVLPRYRPAPLPVSVLLPYSRHLPARVRVFADWIGELLRAECDA